jgi:hypothetical protein
VSVAGTAVFVGVFVGVSVAGTAVFVGVLVGVSVGVLVGVPVGVLVGVATWQVPLTQVAFSWQHWRSQGVVSGGQMQRWRPVLSRGPQRFEQQFACSRQTLFIGRQVEASLARAQISAPMGPPTPMVMPRPPAIRLTRSRRLRGAATDLDRL